MVFEETGLTCSIGISNSRRVSKIASDFKKPNGTTVVNNPKEFLKDLKIQKVSREDQHEKVLSQDPPQGQMVPANSAVKLTVGRFIKKKFVIKNLPQVKSMKGIKMSSGFIKREVEPQSE